MHTPTNYCYPKRYWMSCSFPRIGSIKWRVFVGYIFSQSCLEFPIVCRPITAMAHHHNIQAMLSDRMLIGDYIIFLCFTFVSCISSLLTVDVLRNFQHLWTPIQLLIWRGGSMSFVWNIGHTWLRLMWNMWVVYLLYDCILYINSLTVFWFITIPNSNLFFSSGIYHVTNDVFTWFWRPDTSICNSGRPKQQSLWGIGWKK